MFGRFYQQAVRDVTPFLNVSCLDEIGRHNPGWNAERFDAVGYLATSEIRYATALDVFARHHSHALEDLQFLDVGGFLGPFPLALARLGAQVTLAEKYSYYGGALDGLRDYLEGEGIVVLDIDMGEPLTPLPNGRFDLIAAMAVLEHLPDSPRMMLANVRALLADGGRFVADVPNIAYWPRRIGLLRGHSPLPPIADIYNAEPPFTGHHHEYTAAELTTVLRWSGFTLDELVTLNYTPWPKRPLLRWMLGDLPRRRTSLREVLLACSSCS